MTATPREMANAVRFLALDAIVRVGDGHPGTPLGAADICTALFTRHLRFDPACPRWPDRDRFVQSNGHGSTLIYALLHLCGYAAFPLEQVQRFRELGSNTPGHPEYEPDHGVEITTGPLGQGIANAAGMAVAEAMLNEEFGDDVVRHWTYALVGDGCLMEGLGHEVISLAGHLKLGRLIFLYDSNRMTDDGATSQAVSEDYMVRFACAGWHVQECDGHDQDAIAAAIAAAKADPRPSMIKCNTVIGFGVPRIQDQRVAHGGKLFEDDAQGRARVPRLAARALRRARADPRRVARGRSARRGRARGVGGAARRDRPAAARAVRAPDARRAAVRMGEDAPRLEARGGDEGADAADGALVGRDHARALARDPRARRRRARPRGGDAAQARHAAVHQGRPRRTLPALRGARARDGRDDERHGRAQGRGALRGDVPRVLRLHAPRDAAVGDDVAAGDLGVQPRLDRHRPQRADAPAGRVPGVAACDPQSRGDAPGRRRRGRRVLAARRRQPALAVGDRQLPPGAAAGADRAHGREPVRPRCVRDRGSPGRAAPRHAVRVRVGSRDRTRGAGDAAGAGHCDRGDLGAVLGATSNSRTRRTRRRCSAAARYAWRWRPP